MQVCEFCGTENTDLVGHCTACNEPLSALAAAADVHEADKHHSKSLLRRELVWGVIGVATVLFLGIAGYRSIRRKQLKGTVRDFYTEFRAKDDQYIPDFWKCITRSDKLPTDNIDLETKLDIAIVKSKGGYAKFASTKCLPKIVAAPSALAITPPPMLGDAYEDYVGSVKALKAETEGYIGIVGALEANLQRDQIVQRLGSNYHYAEGESADTYAYDKFLRCAVPDFAKLTDMQGLLEKLAPIVKDPQATVATWRRDCYPILEKASTQTMDPDYKKKVEAFSTDDRDVQAFQDILKAANDKERKSAHPGFGKAWYKFAQARDSLVAKFNEYLGG